MGKSCLQQKKICLGGQYYGMTHPIQQPQDKTALQFLSYYLAPRIFLTIMYLVLSQGSMP